MPRTSPTTVTGGELGLKLRGGLFAAGVLYFASAIGAPVFVYFRADQVGGSHVAAAFVASFALLALAWICVYLLREVELPGSDWRRSNTSQSLLTAGGLATLGGAWLMILGHWGGIVLVLFGTGLVSVGLRMLHTFLTTKGGEQPGEPSDLSDGVVVEEAESLAERMASLTGQLFRGETRTWVTNIAVLVGLVVVIAVANNVARLSSTGVWIVVLGMLDAFLAWAVLPRFWRWREAPGRLAKKQRGMKRFGWRRVDKGFLASAVVVLAALMAIEWYRGDTRWALELAAFVLAGVFVTLLYEGMRRILWALFMGQQYSRVLVCSHCDSEADVWDMACQRCGARFMQDEWPSQR